jgi:hypothetical protein
MHTIVLKVDDFLELAKTRGDTTYEQLSAATGLGVATLHRMRNGGPASSTAIAAICNAYGVAFEDAFTFGTVTPKRVPAERPPRRVKAAAA